MRFERMIALCLAGGALLGCGQKGPLYLPDKTGEVVTRPGPQSNTSENTPPVHPESAPAPAPSESAPATPPVTDSTTDDSSSKNKEPKPK